MVTPTTSSPDQKSFRAPKPLSPEEMAACRQGPIYKVFKELTPAQWKAIEEVHTVKITSIDYSELAKTENLAECIILLICLLHIKCKVPHIPPQQALQEINAFLNDNPGHREAVVKNVRVQFDKKSSNGRVTPVFSSSLEDTSPSPVTAVVTNSDFAPDNTASTVAAPTGDGGGDRRPGLGIGGGPH